MHNISDWGISYEKGSFWESADVDTACPHINAKWFYETDDNEPVISSAYMFGKYIPAHVEENVYDETPRQRARRRTRDAYSGRYAKDLFELLKVFISVNK